MKLSDTEAYDRLHKALLALGKEDGETAVGDTALKAARRALLLLQASLVMKMEEAEGDPPPAKPDQDGA